MSGGLRRRWRDTGRENFPHRPRMPELDAVRGLAALSVVMLHVFSFGEPSGAVVRILQHLVRPGWVGVDVFFVLSGYLITGILLESRDNPAYFSSFYLKRAFRIVPTYYLTAFAAWGVVVWMGNESTTRPVLYSLAFLANLDSVVGFALPSPFIVYWSLAVEEHFYVAWPWLVRRTGPRNLLVVCLGIAALSPVLRAFAFGYSPTLQIYSLTPFRLDGLALGSAIAVLHRWPGTTVARARRIATALLLAGLLAGIALLWAGGWSRASLAGAALQFTAVDLAVAGAFLWLIVLCRNVAERRGPLRPLGFLGDISYFVYLTHSLISLIYDACFPRALRSGSDADLLGRGAMIVAIVLLVGAASRRWFERPLQEYGRGLAQQLTRKSAVALGGQTMPPEAQP